METYAQLKLDDKLIASLDQVLNLDCTLYWTGNQGEDSPPLQMSPDAPDSPTHLNLYDEEWLDDSHDISPSPITSPPLFPSVVLKRKRGRRPLRPFDPIKKKTEEKDKYWLRGFRAYMKSEYSHLRAVMSAEDRVFWKDYLGTGGKPEKGNVYLSYGRKYKNFLFSHRSFKELFRVWFVTKGQEELAKKCEPNSDLWFVFYDYGVKELLTYEPNSTVTSPEIRPVESKSQCDSDDFTMVDTEELTDALLA